MEPTIDSSNVGRADPDSINRPVNFVAVGDIMPGDSAICVGFGMASKMPGRDFSRAIEGAVRSLQGADILFGNLEAVLTECGRGPTIWQREQMRADPAVATVLRTAGFNVISVANNHAMQHGEDGFRNTVQCLREAGIYVVGIRGGAGWTAEPVILTFSKTRVGILAYCWRPRQYGIETPLYAEGNLEQAIADVKKLRAICDCVVVSLHWGEEFSDEPSTSEVRTGDLLLESGASILIGHHPHSIRPIKSFEGGVIAYSLGNFVSDMIWLPSAKTGGIVSCEITSAGITNISTMVVQTNSNFLASPILDKSLPALTGSGLSATEYNTVVSQTVKNQRRLSYIYALRNIYKYELTIFFELCARTVRNKFVSIFQRAFTK